MGKNDTRTRRTRIRRIPFNLYLKNNGKVYLTGLFLTYFLIFEIILISLMIREYIYMGEYQGEDIFELLNKITGEIFILQRYLFLHYFDNIILGSWNSFFSDMKINLYIISFTIEIPYFHEWIKYDTFKMTYNGYIVILISSIISLIPFSFSILQIKEQKKISDLGLHSLYYPLLFIYSSIFNTKYIYLKRVPQVKRDTLNEKKEKQIIQLFFTHSEVYKNNNLDDLVLKEETLKILWGFYNYFRYSIEKTEPKSKKKK